MTVLVTGANGFLGHQVVLELLRRQHTVRIIVRRIRNIYFDLAAVEIVEGSFTDYNDFKSAAKGCDAIIHTAAVTATDCLHYSDYSKINVDGTALIIKVADELKINNLVYVSTTNTIGFGTKQAPADERSPVQFPFIKSYYAQSKLEAEKLMIEASKKPDRHIVIVNPAFMLGAYDTKPGSGKLLIMGYKRRLMFTPKGGKNFVSVNDVAVAVCNALTRGCNGERYLASGVNISFKEYYSLQKELGDYQQTIIMLPDWFMLFVGKAGDILRRLGVKTELCSMNLQQLMIREYYTNQKANAELEFTETNLKTAISEAIEWFVEHKMLNR